ncbi:pyrroline-5-carboxylate reductase [Paenibacillus sp. GCM10023252]|uniref:pyrroline-5-carboxylate reductase n=1 Tax=Paenibacillus sp. GCM10023252 TaxID=3252649 RepID=UPI00360FC15A
MIIRNGIEPGATLGDSKLCFYGAGSMAEALVSGLIEQRITSPDRISMLNRSNAERLTELSTRYGVHTTLVDAEKNRAIAESDILFLAMKPKDADAALDAIRGLIRDKQLIVSLIAGLSISTLERMLGSSVSIVRTMPNTSSSIGLGATGISYSSAVTDHQRALAEAIFQSVGITATIEENLQEAVTGVSGSGPAYVYYFMEAMMKASVQMGMPAEAAQQLIVQTVLGAAEMVRLTGEEPAELRRKVTSPGGATQAAIEVMDRYQFTDAIVQAAIRSAERSAEMGASIERSTLKS